MATALAFGLRLNAGDILPPGERAGAGRTGRASDASACAVSASRAISTRATSPGRSAATWSAHSPTPLWAGPFADTLQTTMVEDLAQRLNGATVIDSNGSIEMPSDLQIEINVLRFDPSVTGDVELTMQVALKAGAEPSIAGRSDHHAHGARRRHRRRYCRRHERLMGLRRRPDRRQRGEHTAKKERRPLFEKSGAKTFCNLGPWRSSGTGPVKEVFCFFFFQKEALLHAFDSSAFKNSLELVLIIRMPARQMPDAL